MQRPGTGGWLASRLAPDLSIDNGWSSACRLPHDDILPPWPGVDQPPIAGDGCQRACVKHGKAILQGE
jgi:hypothetical protein